MTRIKRNDGITLDDFYEFSEGGGRSISESLEVIAVELARLTESLELIAEYRGELER